MSGKNEHEIDLNEIRRMIAGEEMDSGQEISIDEIINEVKVEEKKEKIQRQKKEEEENPFLSLVRETEEIDALPGAIENTNLYVQQIKNEKQNPSVLGTSAEGLFEIPREWENNSRPLQEKTDQKKSIRMQGDGTNVATIPQKEKSKERQILKPLPEVFNVEDLEIENNKTEKATKKHLPADFDKTEFETPKEAADYYKNREFSLNIRSLFILLLSCSSLYLTFAPTFALPLPFEFAYDKTPYLYLFALIALEIGCLLISLDLITAGIMRLVTGRPTVYSLAALAAFSTLAHSVSIILFPKWGGYLPFSSLSCVLLFFMVHSAAQKKSSIWRSIKAETLSSEPMIIKIDKEAVDKPCAVRSCDKNIKVYEKTLLAPDPLEQLCTYYVPCVIIVSIVFSFVATFGQNRPEL
ncbi:MAG: hypothetical protein N2Z65_04680, partial [Clostridiales bacterium]|nr:hypothetical protein [Clostridiales bacterium]